MMPSQRSLTIFAAAALALATAAGPALAFDLTGTWTGTIKCKEFVNGVKDKFELTPTITISQSGNALGILATFGPGDSDMYTALANPDAKKPDKGEFAIIFCGTDNQVGNSPTFDEIGRMQVTTKTGKIAAKFRGESIFSDPADMGPEAGTCKWSWKRVDTVDPWVATTCAM